MNVENPFVNNNESERYSKFRPQYHHMPFAQINEYIGKKVDRALDVACGTGHSTSALAEISNSVVGCDLSNSMLQEAYKNYQLEFIQAAAENLPFNPGEFELVNISMGFHWVEQVKFLSEARRVLKNKGYLCIDSYGFNGQISTDANKQQMHSELFDEHLPNASRRDRFPTVEAAQQVSFQLQKEFKYEHHLNLTQEEFMNLIMTWSNFQIQNNDQKNVTLNRMKNVYDKIFEGQSLKLKFHGKTMLFQKI